MQAQKKLFGIRAAQLLGEKLAEDWTPPVEVLPYDNKSIIREQTLEVSQKYHQQLKEQKERGNAPRNISEPFTLFFTELAEIDLNPKRVTFSIQVHKDDFPDSYWANCQFRFQANFPESYPAHPPHVFCKTSIFHPNISPEGIICLSLLEKTKWNPRTTIYDVIFAILVSLFQEPNPDNDKEASALLKSDQKAFRERTKAHAEAHGSFIPGSDEHIEARLKSKAIFASSDLTCLGGRLLRPH